MKKLSTLWDNTKNYIYKHYGQESGKMIVHAGVITWFTATASQVFAIAVNKKVSEDQKKFLIPQEIADGAINILAFYTITSSMKNIAGKLASSGKWSTKAIRDFAEQNKTKLQTPLGDLKTDLEKTFNGNDEFHKTYDTFKGGLDMIAATAGSVVACNVATPFIRNYIGAKQQKQSIDNKYKNQTFQPKTGMKV